MKKITDKDLSKFHEFFDNFSKEDMEIFINYTTKFTLNKNRFLFNEGSLSEKVYFLQKGKICLQKETGEILQSGEGSIIGGIEVLLKKQKYASAFALERCSIFFVDISKIRNEAKDVFEKIILGIHKVDKGIFLLEENYYFQSLKKEISERNKKIIASKIIIYIFIFFMFLEFIKEFFLFQQGVIHNLLLSNVEIIALTIFTFYVIVINKFSIFSFISNKESFKKSIKFNGIISLFFIVSSLLLSFFFFKEKSSYSIDFFNKAGNLEKNILISNIIFIPVHEFLLRGMIQPILSYSFTEKFNIVVPILLPVIIINFALFYGDNTFLFTISILFGSMIGYAYHKTKNFVAGLLSHIVMKFSLTFILGFII